MGNQVMSRKVTFSLFLFYFLMMRVTPGCLHANENGAVKKRVFMMWKRKSRAETSCG